MVPSLSVERANGWRPDSAPTADPYLPRRLKGPWDSRQLLHVRSWKLRLSADDRLLPEQMLNLYINIGMLSRRNFLPPCTFPYPHSSPRRKSKVQLAALRAEAGFRLSPE